MEERYMNLATDVIHDDDHGESEGARRASGMKQDLEKVEYRKGMLEKGMKLDELPVKVWSGTQIPAEMRKAINEENPGSHPRSRKNACGYNGRDDKRGNPEEIGA